MTSARRVRLSVAAALTALALGGCGEDGKNPISAAQDAARDATQNAADKVARKAYEAATIAALSAIEPGLASDPQRALDQAKKACAAVKGKNSTEAVAQIRRRFDGPAVDVDTATAKKILTVLKKDFCPNL